MASKIGTTLLLLAFATLLGTASFAGSVFADHPNETASNSTASTTANAEMLTGEIGSVQLDEEYTPLWITTGDWWLELDGPLATENNTTQQTNVTAFNATMHMVMLTNGSALHKHEIYDFVQTDLTQTGNHTTFINGTMTVTMMDGPRENVAGYIRISNDAIAIWVEPMGVDRHFGTTPIYGIVTPESEMEHDGMETMTAANQTDQATTNNTMAGNANTAATNQNKIPSKTIEMAAMKQNQDGEEMYRWSVDNQVNPEIGLLLYGQNVIKVDNPTDETHNLIIKDLKSAEILATTQDLGPGQSVQLTVSPDESNTQFRYYCEYHPNTMQGGVNIIDTANDRAGLQ